MENENIRTEVLLELIFSFQSKAGEDKSIMDCLKVYTRKLNCHMGAVLKFCHGNLEEKLILPFSFKKQGWSDIRKMLSSGHMGANGSFSEFCHQQFHYYVYRLDAYGLLVLGKKQPLETPIKNELKNVAGFLGKGLMQSIEEERRRAAEKRLEHALKEAQAASVAKQNFLANMSHEIRTPMTGILGMLEFLLQTPLTSEQKEYLDVIRSSSDSLLNIINDILDFSKIEAGKLSLDPSPLDIRKLASESGKLFASLAKQKKLELKVFVDDNLPRHLLLDKVRLGQVISNLLANAIKFTSSGYVALRLFQERCNDNSVNLKIEVEDTGEGINSKDQKLLFSSFSQVDASSTRKNEGTGLGLAICQNIVQLMGGEILLKSQPGKGSTFYFTIPAPVHHGKDLATPIKISNNEDSDKQLNLRILMVEDKTVNQKVIGLMLKSMGCQCTHAPNGRKAIELLENHHRKSSLPAFDIILMDIHMPEMDGLTATRIIRRSFPQYPVIIGLSANVLRSDVEKFLKNGFDDYISKPVKSERLRQKLLHWQNHAISA